MRAALEWARMTSGASDAHGLGITAAPSVIDQDVVRWSNPVVGDALSWVAPPRSLSCHLAANRMVWMIMVLSLSLSGGVCMARLRVQLLYNFADCRCRSTSLERLPVLFDAARRRNSPGFRLWRPTPAAVVSRSLQVQGRTCTAWMSSAEGKL